MTVSSLNVKIFVLTYCVNAYLKMCFITQFFQRFIQLSKLTVQVTVLVNYTSLRTHFEAFVLLFSTHIYVGLHNCLSVCLFTRLLVCLMFFQSFSYILKLKRFLWQIGEFFSLFLYIMGFLVFVLLYNKLEWYLHCWSSSNIVSVYTHKIKKKQ